MSGLGSSIRTNRLIVNEAAQLQNEERAARTEEADPSACGTERTDGHPVPGRAEVNTTGTRSKRELEGGRSFRGARTDTAAE